MGGASRLATFQDAGNHDFALSAEPDSQADYPRAASYEVAIVFDTSATQTGLVRIEALEVLDELAATLPAGTRVSLLACDVETVLLSDGLVATTDPKWETAVRVSKHFCLGATDLGIALRTAAQQLKGSRAQPHVSLYIGDGVNRFHFFRINTANSFKNWWQTNAIVPRSPLVPS